MSMRRIHLGVVASARIPRQVDLRTSGATVQNEKAPALPGL